MVAAYDLQLAKLKSQGKTGKEAEIEAFTPTTNVYGGNWIMQNFPQIKPGPVLGKIKLFWTQKYGDKIEVTRFKGLGEMDADELGTTTMEIGKRQIIKVNIDDLDEASRILSVLMGSNVAPRKEHIIKKSAQRVLELNNG
jgi:DNA gyrase/topoisomerase IV subunit B